MSRLVIDVSGEQHQQIKALAALQGKTIKDFILERLALGSNRLNQEEMAWNELESLLLSRIEAAEAGEISNKPFTRITQEILQERRD